MSTFYVVTLDGTPLAVSTEYYRAAQMAKEMETKFKKAAIIPTRSLEDDFESEEPTEPDKPRCECQECLCLSATPKKP
jgi:hypothetical protein